MRELELPQITEFIEERRNWKEHIERMSTDRTARSQKYQLKLKTKFGKI
jgi:hypothetical protein